jgi:hypothetical protein
MRRPTRATAAGKAYLDLQNRARADGRATQELLALYVVERWLARLSMSPYADQFIIKGGMLLAAYDARRPTADLDALAHAVLSGHSVSFDHSLRICRDNPDSSVATALVQVRIRRWRRPPRPDCRPGSTFWRQGRGPAWRGGSRR